MTADLGNALDLRTEMIPRGPLIRAIERETGQRLTHENRHYLANEPVHCGDKLELFKDGQWVYGRYEWTGDPEDLPTFQSEDGCVHLDGACSLRWPQS